MYSTYSFLYGEGVFCTVQILFQCVRNYVQYWLFSVPCIVVSELQVFWASSDTCFIRNMGSFLRKQSTVSYFRLYLKTRIDHVTYSNVKAMFSLFSNEVDHQGKST